MPKMIDPDKKAIAEMAFSDFIKDAEYHRLSTQSNYRVSVVDDYTLNISVFANSRGIRNFSIKIQEHY